MGTNGESEGGPCLAVEGLGSGRWLDVGAGCRSSMQTHEEVSFGHLEKETTARWTNRDGSAR